jgi:diacylglycerol O-acyltransferase
MDAGFLYMETPTLHMHTLKIAVVDPSSVPGGYSFARFKEELGKRLHLLPPFRRRIVPVPFALHHPVWIEDPGFSLDYHVRRVGVPPPGGQREMDELIGEIASYQLDRHHPLWQIWVIEGLQDGMVAFCAKIHHAAADGVAAQALLANALSVLPEPADPEQPAKAWRPDRIPRKTELIAAALRDYLTAWRALPALIARTVRNLRALTAHRKAATVTPPRPIVDAPKTSFNAPLTPERAFATASLPLDDFKQVKDAFGVTLNDVVLAVVAASVRRYLKERGEVLDKPLIAGVPVSADKPDAIARLGGNKVSNLFTSLRTDLDDPVERLRSISQITRAAKDAQNILGADMMADWVEYTPPGPFAWFMRQYSRFGLASPADQLGRVERAGSPANALRRGRAIARAVLGRTRPGRHRPQRHRLVLHRPDELRRDRRARAPARGAPHHRRSRRWARRATQSRARIDSRRARPDLERELDTHAAAASARDAGTRATRHRVPAGVEGARRRDAADGAGGGRLQRGGERPSGTQRRCRARARGTQRDRAHLPRRPDTGGCAHDGRARRRRYRDQRLRDQRSGHRQPGVCRQAPVAEGLPFVA